MSNGKSEGQYQIFIKYTREYLAQVTGYSKGYLCKIATGKQALPEGFVSACCRWLKESEDDLFRLVEPDERCKPPAPLGRPDQDLLDTIDELAHRLTDAEAAIKALQDELKQYS